MYTLSKRLLAIANMTENCICAADIGTDHAYIPIYLCKNNIAKKCIAGDVSKGSAKKAEDNVSAENLSEYISVRCGNGLEIIKKEDNVDQIIIAGMGGMLMTDILKDGCLDGVKRLVLQPQKDIPEVRRFLHAIGFAIEDETALVDEGKFYNIISAVPGKDAAYTETEYELGKKLLEKGDVTLKKHIMHEMTKAKELLPKVNEKRQAELLHMLDIYTEGMKCL